MIDLRCKSPVHESSNVLTLEGNCLLPIWCRLPLFTCSGIPSREDVAVDRVPEEIVAFVQNGERVVQDFSQAASLRLLLGKESGWLLDTVTWRLVCGSADQSSAQE